MQGLSDFNNIEHLRFGVMVAGTPKQENEMRLCGANLCKVSEMIRVLKSSVFVPPHSFLLWDTTKKPDFHLINAFIVIYLIKIYI